LIFKDVEFTLNEASNGGAVSSHEQNNNMMFDHCNFKFNFVRNGYGGSLYFQDAHENIFINNSLFENSTAIQGRGGALYSSDIKNLDIRHSEFSRCRAEDGGAIAMPNDHINVSITDSSFTQNNASTYGGAVSQYYNAVQLCQYV
jgi:hypothetical protein